MNNPEKVASEDFYGEACGYWARSSVAALKLGFTTDS